MTREQFLFSIWAGLVGAYFLYRSQDAGYKAAKTGSRVFGPGAEPTVVEVAMARWGFRLSGAIMAVNALVATVAALTGHLSD